MSTYNQGVADSNRRRAKHGEAAKLTSLYNTWRSIRQRCLNPQHKHYHRYGGRGITMCEAWAASYEAFKADVGEPASGMSLDRIDNNGNYEPNNVRWATRKAQANNRTTNVVVEHDGKSMTLKQWAEHLGWKYGLLGSRWKKGVRGAELFAPPEYTRGAFIEFNGEVHTLPEWEKISGVKYQTLRWRAKHGKPLL